VKTNFTTQIFIIKHSLTYSTASASLGGSFCFQACVYYKLALVCCKAVSEVTSPNGVSPLLLYCAASLSAAESAEQPLDASMTVQCARAALQDDRLDLLTVWITHNDRCVVTWFCSHRVWLARGRDWLRRSV